MKEMKFMQLFAGLLIPLLGTTLGSAQGNIISPVLANIYMHFYIIVA